MNNINAQLKQLFDANFEELSAGSPPLPASFSIWGKDYVGKWRHHTMTMFLNDLNELVQGKQDVIDEAEVTKDEKIESLEAQIEDLEQELKEARGE